MKRLIGLRTPHSALRTVGWCGRRNGQHMAEYAIALAVAVAAIGGMSTYVRRALQGRVKAYTDHYLAVEENDISFGIITKGDLDGNGFIDTQDLSLFDQGVMCRQERLCDDFLTPAQKATLDMDGNGVLDAADYIYMVWLYDNLGGYQVSGSTPFISLDTPIIRLPQGRGDLNGDGEVTPDEAAKVYDYAFERVRGQKRPLAQPVTLSPAELAAADANADGVVNADDYEVMWPAAYDYLTLHPLQVRGVSFETGEGTQALGIEYERPSDVLPGDLDEPWEEGYGKVEINDLVEWVGYFLGLHPLTQEGLDAADANGDGDINILDIVKMVSLALGETEQEPASTSTTTTGPSRRSETSGLFHTGDLDGNGEITIDELLRAVNAFLGIGSFSAQELALLDIDGNGQIQVNDIITMVNFALHGIDAGRVAREILVEEHDTLERTGKSLIRNRSQLPPRFIAPRPLTTDLDR